MALEVGFEEAGRSIVQKVLSFTFQKTKNIKGWGGGGGGGGGGGEGGDDGGGGGGTCSGGSGGGGGEAKKTPDTDTIY